MQEETKRRIADNEAIVRGANEDVQAAEADKLRRAASDRLWDFLCECGDADCHGTLRLTTEEYERVRSNPVRFVVAPGHERIEVEVVVERADRFVVIEKRPGERDVALATNPRS